MSLFTYIAYGLTFSSTLALPELLTVEHTQYPDVLVYRGRVELRPPEGDFAEGYVCGTSEEAYIFVEEVGAFLVQHGREIVVDPAPGASEATLRVFILGGALGLLLQQRGLMTLHASAVATPAGAAAFAGPSGVGKSSLAAAMHTCGYTIVADDVTALVAGSTRAAMVLPAFPRLKIWPRVAATLGYDQTTLAVSHAADRRRDYRAVQAFAEAPHPLRQVYILTDDSDQQIERLAPQDAFFELLGCSYAAGLLGEAGATPAHLEQCASIAGRVPVYRFSRPLKHKHLRAQARLVDAHLRETSSL